MNGRQRKMHAGFTLWHHDCDTCKPLGHTGFNEEWVDWYYCPGSLGGSILGRYGDEAHEYWSMSVDVLRTAPTAGSLKMQIAKGLVNMLDESEETNGN